MRSILSLSSRMGIPPRAAALRTALALTSLAAISHFAAAAAQDPKNSIWYKAETLITRDAKGREQYAGAGTVVLFDNRGKAIFIAFARADAQGQGIFQGEYGVDSAGRRLNDGRLIYKGDPLTYLVAGPKDIYKYHLKYLELTTAGDEAHGRRAYATKAIAFDNKVEKSAGAPSAYELPEGGRMIIDKGEIKFGENLASPNYDLSGNISAMQAHP